MKLDQVKNLGKKLSNAELKNISGGASVHGICNNGSHFTFLIREGLNVEQTISDINMTICGGGGVDTNVVIFRDVDIN